jgi:hypothetical protein
MKFNYQDSSNKPGIYKIINIHTNRIYIGQASRFERRWYDHKKNLLNGNHKNKFLLNDFNKCKEELGHDDFLEFHVIQVMENSTKEQRNNREEQIIAEHYDKQENCYNFKQKAESKERSCFSNTPEKTKATLSEKAKELWANPEYKELISQKAKEIWNTPEGKEKAIKRNKEAWNSEERKQKASERMKTRMNSLTPEQWEKQLANLAKGRTPQSYETYQKNVQDFMKDLRKTTVIKERKDFVGQSANKAKWFKDANLISLDLGILYENIFNLRAFATKFDLDSWKLQELIEGKRESHKRWIKL